MERFIFLDRDGVINRDPQGFTNEKYVTSWEGFQFLPGALEAIRDLSVAGFKIAVISNQAGVRRGIYTKEALDMITARMVEAIESKGGRIYTVKYCLHIEDDNCDCRKPRTGLLRMAAGSEKIHFDNTFLIGDNKKDIEAGRAMGCKTILVLSGMTKASREADAWPVKPDFIKKDLREAADLVLGQEKR